MWLGTEYNDKKNEHVVMTPTTLHANLNIFNI